MDIKKFTVEHTPTAGKIVVEIDLDYVFKIKTENGGEDYTVIDIIKKMGHLWSGYEQSLKENDYDYIKTFLIKLCEKLLRVSAYNSVKGIIEYVESEECGIKLDGTFGIKLISIYDLNISEQKDFKITEIKLL